MSPFPVDAAREWWRHTLERADPRAIVLVARDEAGIVEGLKRGPERQSVTTIARGQPAQLA